MPPRTIQSPLSSRSLFQNGSAWALSLVISLSAFLAPALWNGFAIIFYDSGGYVERVLEMTLSPGRSLFYGFFLWAMSLGWYSFWGPILAQSLFTLWIIHLTLRCHDLPAGPLTTAAFCTGLAGLTGISWYTSQLMPDILVPLMVIGLWLLGFRWDKLMWSERGALAALILLGLLSHMSCLALAMGLILGILLAKLALRRRKGTLPIFLLPPTAVVAAGLILMPMLHLCLTGKAGYTPGGPVFIFGRLVQDGIAQRWLAENCPAPGIRLCGMQDRMPKTADDFLWSHTSPFQDLGGWSGTADAELGFLMQACIKAYPGTFIRTSLQATARQMMEVATGDGLDEFQHAARGVFTKLLPRTAQSFNAARQQQELITQPLFDFLNAVHVPVAHLSMLGLLLIAYWGLRNRRHDLAGLALFTLLALLGNAFICGALSNPHDRYQSRLVWIAPLVCAMAMMAYRQRYKKHRHVSLSSGLEKTQGSF